MQRTALRLRACRLGDRLLWGGQDIECLQEDEQEAGQLEEEEARLVRQEQVLTD